MVIFPPGKGNYVAKKKMVGAVLVLGWDLPAQTKAAIVLVREAPLEVVKPDTVT